MTTFRFRDPIYITRPILPDIEEVYGKLQEIWSSKQLTNNGPQLKQLERMLVQYLNVPGISLFSNGTIALMIATKALQLSGEVITTPFTFAATPHSLVWNKLEPVFCDIRTSDLTIDPEQIERYITPRTTAILGVHVFGNPCDVTAIESIAKKHNLKVIYDGAHSFGSMINNRGIGNFGDVTMFSFHATKLFHSIEGGALAYRDPEIGRSLELLKNFGIESENMVTHVGINGKMNEVQAAIGQIVLSYIEDERTRRSRLYDLYLRELSGVYGIRVIELRRGGVSPSYQYLPILIQKEQFGKSRDEVYEELKQYNVFARKYFYPLCSNFSCYSKLASSNPLHLPVANKIVNEVLCLPFYGALSDEEVLNICHIIREMRSRH